MEDTQNGAEPPIVSDHHTIIEEGHQEAAIGAFLLAHQAHTQEVEVQRGAWTVYCRCRCCDDVRSYEVDNEARERALGLPPWPESKKLLVRPIESDRRRVDMVENVSALDAYREGELPLPPGYAIEHGSDVLLLRREGGTMVAAFSARGATAKEVKRTAWDDHKRSTNTA